jgi:hypothetical protein
MIVVMKKREIMGSLPAVGASLLPNLACPACWPAYASLLSAVGLTFLLDSRHLFWVNGAALLVGLMVLSRRSRTRGYRPLALRSSRGTDSIRQVRVQIENHHLAWSRSLCGGVCLE